MARGGSHAVGMKDEKSMATAQVFVEVAPGNINPVTKCHPALPE